MAKQMPEQPAWFDLEEYCGVDRLDFQGWRTQIGNRIYLDWLLAAQKLSEFDAQFSTLEKTPFFDLGFSTAYLSDSAVSPLTFGVAQTIVATLAPLSPNYNDACDQKLLKNGQTAYASSMHLSIDLTGSKQEIERDFFDLLTAAMPTQPKRLTERRPGITKSVLKSWARHQILPFQDLHLWHRRHKAKMPSATVLANWLFANDENGEKDKALDTIEKATSVFSLTTLRQLAIADRMSTASP